MSTENVTIGEALENATTHLGGDKFSDEDLAIVDAAFARFGKTRPSDDKAECASALMKLLSS